MLEDKICLSLNERENLFEIIKKNVKNFNKLSKKSKSKVIKSIKEKLSSYIDSINEDKYITIDTEHINSIKYYNNFSKNSIVVPNRDTSLFYIQNNEDQKGLLFIEFYLTDEKKDIIFKLSKYDPKEDDFVEIYDSGKLGKKCKITVYFEEKTLYQIEFDNKYSWINSKEVNFTFSLYKISDEKIENIKDNIENKNEDENKTDIKNNEDKKENQIEEKQEHEEEIKKDEEIKESDDNKEFKVSKAILNNRKTIKFNCNYGDQSFVFNCNKIYKKIKGYQELEKNNLIKKNEFKLTLLIYMNQLRILTFDNNDKLKYTEVIDENEEIITKELFNNTIINYLNENYKKENNDNKIVINLYSQNKNLSQISTKIKDLITALKDYSVDMVDQTENKICEQFLKKLGFNPDKKLGEYEITYNLFDFSDQCLLYHLFLIHCQEKEESNSTLVMIFDKNDLHITAINEGDIFTKFKSLENKSKQKYYSKLKKDDFKSIADFITLINDSFSGMDLVLCYMNNDEKKDDLLALFKQIKEYAIDELDEEMNVYIYNEDDLVRKMIKYIWLFAEEK